MKQRVVVGLSGGVDSSVAAALLKDKGYEVVGAYMTCWSGAGCRDEEDKKDALDVALQLNIPFVHLDFRAEYKQRVYEYMIREYELGRTPNPDVVCNREIKFGLFYEWARKQGYDFVATGHYAQIGVCDQHSDFCSPRLPQAGSGCGLKNQKCCLLRSVDERKDQTYFLWQLRQEQLRHILFPIGHLTKDKVRREAVKRRLVTAKKPDSQGICFIGEVRVSKFLEERIKVREGEIWLNGEEVGKHNGVWFYTIGQKIRVDQRKIRGFDKTNLPHFYVVKKDLEKNRLYVGTREQLWTDTLVVGEIHLITNDKLQITSESDVYVRIRHGGELVKVKKIQKVNDKCQIKLEKAVWGVAPGQSAVLYKKQECVGGGIMNKSRYILHSN